jgi:hypothetical protein
MTEFSTWSSNAKKSVLSTIRDGCQVAMAGQGVGGEFLKGQVGYVGRENMIIRFKMSLGSRP